MRLSFGQEMRMSQKQILAPRMIQSMEILQLPIQALQERIEQEIQENPCLDIQEMDPDLPEEETAEAEKPDAPTIDEKELVVDENKDNKDDFERLLEMDQEWPDHFEERTRPSSQRIEEESDRKHDAMANMAEGLLDREAAYLTPAECQSRNWGICHTDNLLQIDRINSVSRL